MLLRQFIAASAIALISASALAEFNHCQRRNGQAEFGSVPLYWL